MSVLARFRSESPFEVRDNARKLEVRIMKLCMNEKYFPKRYRFVLTNDVIDSAHKMVDSIEAANYLPLSEAYKSKRLGYQKDALCKIQDLFRKLMLAEELGFTIPEATLIDLGQSLCKEETLIKNWMDSDRERLK